MIISRQQDSLDIKLSYGSRDIINSHVRITAAAESIIKEFRSLSITDKDNFGLTTL